MSGLGKHQRAAVRLVADHPGTLTRNAARHRIGLGNGYTAAGYRPVNTLQQRGLVELDNSGRMHLTAAGTALAESMDGTPQHAALLRRVRLEEDRADKRRSAYRTAEARYRAAVRTARSEHADRRRTLWYTYLADKHAADIAAAEALDRAESERQRAHQRAERI